LNAKEEFAEALRTQTRGEKKECNLSGNKAAITFTFRAFSAPSKFLIPKKGKTKFRFCPAIQAHFLTSSMPTTATANITATVKPKKISV
jgi:hypothetical protein